MMRRNQQIGTAIPFSKVRKYLARLVCAEERIDYKAGQVLFYEGHRPYGLYILRTGRVRLFRKKDGNGEELLKIIGPPQIVGEGAFVQRRPFSYSAKAETDISVSFFSRAVIYSKETVMGEK